MPNPRYLSGRRAEQLLKREFEALGYCMTRSAGSKGRWDLIGIWPGGSAILIQVKGLKRGASHAAVVRKFREKAIIRSSGYLQVLYVRQNGAWHIYQTDTER